MSVLPQDKWVKDDEVTACQLCHVEFAMYRRRHHCRNCGKCVCVDCSDKYFPLDEPTQAVSGASPKKLERVCTPCFDKLNAAESSMSVKKETSSSKGNSSEQDRKPNQGDGNDLRERKESGGNAQSKVTKQASSEKSSPYTAVAAAPAPEKVKHVDNLTRESTKPGTLFLTPPDSISAGGSKSDRDNDTEEPTPWWVRTTPLGILFIFISLYADFIKPYMLDHPTFVGASLVLKVDLFTVPDKIAIIVQKINWVIRGVFVFFIFVQSLWPLFKWCLDILFFPSTIYTFLCIIASKLPVTTPEKIKTVMNYLPRQEWINLNSKVTQGVLSNEGLKAIKVAINMDIRAYIFDGIRETKIYALLLEHLPWTKAYLQDLWDTRGASFCWSDVFPDGDLSRKVVAGLLILHFFGVGHKLGITWSFWYREIFPEGVLSMFSKKDKEKNNDKNKNKSKLHKE